MKNFKLPMNRGFLSSQTIADIFSDNNEVYDLICTSKDYLIDNFESDQLKSLSPIELNEYSYINMKYVKETENNFKSNLMVQQLNIYFNKQSVKEVIHKYRIGTSKTWDGATIFWYIDIHGKVCSGETMKFDYLYNEPIGFDDKPFVDSMRAILYKQGLIDDSFNQKNILFGEHLLKNSQKPIAIVESEKTAVIASLEYPDFTWLATGIDSQLTFDKFKVLEGFDVTLCPNNHNFKLWYKKAIEYGFKISLLTKHELSWKGNPKTDLSDWILKRIQMDEYYFGENQD